MVPTSGQGGLLETQVARQAEMLANRVKKTYRHLRRRFERRQVGAFRLYDWDIPEIRLVVDWYEGHLVVAEYGRRQTADIADYVERLGLAAAAALDVPAENVHLKTRRTRPAAGPRYQRLGSGGQRLVVREGELRFWVNLDDYIDTGLFLDHRETRALVGQESRDRAVLNLYGYTGSFTCHAAWGGARRTTTVDASSTYLDWAHDNLVLNGLAGPGHRLLRAEVRDYLARTARTRERFDLCVLDPPSFSDRQGKKGPLDLQRDHRALISETLAVLEPGGVLYFSTNHQRFEPDLEGLPVAECEEITARTIPEDFRNRTVHRAWRLRR